MSPLLSVKNFQKVVSGRELRDDTQWLEDLSTSLGDILPKMIKNILPVKFFVQNEFNGDIY